MYVTKLFKHLTKYSITFKCNKEEIKWKVTSDKINDASNGVERCTGTIPLSSLSLSLSSTCYHVVKKNKLLIMKLFEEGYDPTMDIFLKPIKLPQGSTQNTKLH